MSASPIAIVGVSALFAGSNDTDGFWRDIMSGRDLMTDVPATHWPVEEYYDPTPGISDRTYANRGSFLGEVDFAPMEFGIPPNILPATDTSQLLALVVAKRLIESSHGAFERVRRERIGVVLGASTTELCLHMAGRLQNPLIRRAMVESGLEADKVDEVMGKVDALYVPWDENTFPGLLGNVVAGRIANRFDLGGTNCCVDAACASSLAAIDAAVNELSVGRADLMISGGVDVLNDILMYVCFSQTGALSRTGDCRPFSSEADGTMLAEGLGLFAMKRLEDAERDGDSIHAVIRGIGASSDGRAKSIYAPRPEGQASALRRAYEVAGYDPSTVELVEAHGTATVAGDAAETSALREVFGGARSRRTCALGSVKSQIGHAKAAAGAAGMFKAVMALQHRVLPPSIKIDEPNPRLELADSPFYLNTEARPWIRPAGHPRRASVSAFGFGGTNFHVTLEEYRGPGRRAGRRRTMPSELVLLSAANASELARTASRLADEVDQRDADSLRWLARQTQVSFDARAPARLALVATDDGDLGEKLRRAARGDHSGDGMFAGTGVAGQVALLFGGRGAEYVGMGSELAMHFDAACDLWDLVAGVQIGAAPLTDYVFPPPAFGDEERLGQLARLRGDAVAFASTTAASLAVLRLLGELGLDARYTAGAEGGELTSLVAAGVAAEDDAVRLAHRRGELGREGFESFVAGAPEGVRMHLAANASFHDRIEKLYDAGVRTFIDVGPSDQMSRRLAEILGSRPHHRIAVDGGIESLWRALGRLSALGVNLGYASLWRDYDDLSDPTSAGKPSFSVQLTGANYAKPFRPQPESAAEPTSQPSSRRPARPAAPSSPEPAAVAETRDWLQEYRDDQRAMFDSYKQSQQTMAEAHVTLLQSMVFGGTAPRTKTSPQAGTVTFDPATDTWLADHRPTFTRPALPMTCVMDQMAQAVRHHVPDGRVVELRGVEVFRWLPIDGPTTFQLRVEAIPSAPDWFVVRMFEGDEEVAHGHVRCAADFEPAAPRPIPDAGFEPRELPYPRGLLFHGPAFQRLTQCETGFHAARGTLTAEPPHDVGLGELYPALLDAAIHLIPYDELYRWADSLPAEHLAYPLRVDQLVLHGEPPQRGTLELDVQFAGVEPGNHPAFDLQIHRDGRLWAQMRLVEAMFPKGRLGSGDPEERRRFLRDRRFVRGFGLSEFDGDTTRIAIPQIRKNDWFDGTVAALYGVSGDLREQARQVAIKDHFAQRWQVHPSAIRVDGETATAAGHAPARATVSMDGPMTFVVR